VDQLTRSVKSETCRVVSYEYAAVYHLPRFAFCGYAMTGWAYRGHAPTVWGAL
jgi:hypothetical protein